jgi:hypothetical protein
VAFVAIFTELKQPQGKADHSAHLSDEFKKVTSTQRGSWTPRILFLCGFHWSIVYGTGKGKFHPSTGLESPEGE